MKFGKFRWERYDEHDVRVTRWMASLSTDLALGGQQQHLANNAAELMR
jgi:hypothetical protein